MNQTTLTSIGGRPVLWDGKVMAFVSGLTIDADGSPRAYGPDNKGLDFTANGGRPGNWWAVVTDAKGQPVVQGPSDPAPGMYVSTTTYERRKFANRDPRRYVDSETVPYVVIPAFLRKRVPPIVVGCRAVVRHVKTGAVCEAVVADLGPADHLGEGSVALARALGINADARRGGTDAAVIEYRIFPGVAAVVNGETFELQGV